MLLDLNLFVFLFFIISSEYYKDFYLIYNCINREKKQRNLSESCIWIYILCLDFRIQRLFYYIILSNNVSCNKFGLNNYD